MSRMPISRQIETIVELRMFIITGSAGEPSFTCTARFSIGMRGWTIGKRMSRSPSSFSVDHCTHQSEQKTVVFPARNPSVPGPKTSKPQFAHLMYFST